MWAFTKLDLGYQIRIHYASGGCLQGTKGGLVKLPQVFDSFSLGFQRFATVFLRISNRGCDTFCSVKVWSWSWWVQDGTGDLNSSHGLSDLHSLFHTETLETQLAGFPTCLYCFLLSQRWLTNLGMFSCGLFLYQTFSGVFTTDVTEDGRGFQGPLPAEHLYWSFWSPPWNEQIPTAFFTPLRLQDLPAAWRFQGMKIVVWPQLYGCLKFTTQKLEMKSVFYVEPWYPGIHPLSSLRGCQGHLEVRNFCTALW